jgi:hypothetical protein
MENNYYKPESSDFFIGYRYEYFDGNEWVKTMVYSDCTGTDLTPIIKNGRHMDEPHIRVRYMDKQQLIDDKWEEHENGFLFKKISGAFYFIWISQAMIEGWHPTMISINIGKNMKYLKSEQIYRGLCPSINEFRKICELLNIM